ncbi:MAG: S-layer homology domain-containing protein [Firmicutes bacterium]|nr:S-layer homology domain-containing protein [Bacillota bacterium]
MGLGRVATAWALSLALAVAPSLTAQSPSGGGAPYRYFRDEGEAQWAITYLARVVAKGLLKGYPGGEFRPNSDVSRAEVVVALMRALPRWPEFEDPGRGLADLCDGDLVSSGWPWAVEAVERAVRMGIVDPEGGPFDPGGPARRAWVAEVISRGLGLNSDPGDGLLPFADAGEVHPDKLGYVAAVNDLGVMTGYKDADGLPRFGPERTITRAEFAAVLDRCSRHAGPVGGFEVRGRVLSVDAKKKRVSINAFAAGWWERVRKVGYWDSGDVHAGVIDLPVADAATILLDDKPVALSSLKKGQVVSVAWNNEGFAVLVDATSATSGPWPEIGKSQAVGTLLEVKDGGVPVLVFRDMTGKTRAYGVGAGCKVSRNGKTAETTSLVAGDKVTLQIADCMLRSIVAEEQEPTTELEGLVRAVSVGRDASLWLADDRGATREFQVSPQCSVTRKGRRATLLEVKSGDRARVRARGDVVVDLDVLAEGDARELEGVVREIRLGSDGEIRIRDSEGDDLAYRLSPSCVVKCGGAGIGIGDVHVGDRVLLEIASPPDDGDWQVRNVTVRRTDEKGGWVEAMETDSVPPRLRVRLFSGSLLAAWMDPDAGVWRKGKQIDEGDVKPGDRVNMSMVDGVVVRLEVLDSLSAIEGVVEAVEPSRKRLTIGLGEEQSLTVTLAEDAKITYVKQVITLGEVKPGDRVQVKVKDGKATALEVEDRVSRIVEGQVTRVTTGSNPKVWVKPSEGPVASYVLASDVGVEFDGFPLEASDILKDDAVQMRVYGNRVTRVTIVRRPSFDALGAVVSVVCDLTGGYAIRIRDEEQRLVSYKVRDDATVRRGAEQIDLADLKEGGLVMLRVAGNVVTRITLLQ